MQLYKAVLIAVLPVVSGYAIAKSYIHYKTRAAIELVVAQVARFGELKYGSISSTLPNGTVQVEQLAFTLQGIPDSITVRSVSLSAGGFFDLLKLARQSTSKTPPESMSIRFDDLRLDANGPLLQFADRMAQASATATGVSHTTPHCGNQATNGIGFVRRLGYGAFVIDGGFDYRVDKRSGSVLVNTEFEVEEMARGKVRLTMRAVEGAPPLTGTPAVKDIEITYKDLSYKDRMKSYCARAANITQAQYVDAELNFGVLRQQFGIVPGPGLKAAYREFLEVPNAEVKLRMQPSEDFDPRNTKLFQPEYVLQQLNAMLTVNNKLVEDLSFAYGVAAPAPTPAVQRQSGETTPAPEPIKPAPSPIAAEPSKPAIAKEESRTVPINELARYVNRNVRLHESGREPREGVLVRIIGNVAEVQRQYGTGNVTIKVPLSRVARAEILDD